MPVKEAVRAHALTRSFGARVAVRNLSITLHRGEIIALLGPNGAGKTTTLRMLAGLIPPSSGSVELDGVGLHAKSADVLRQRVGFLTESPGLWDRLSVQFNLSTYARLYGLTKPQEAVDRALTLVALSDRRRDVAGALSKGLRQRLALARALITNPNVLVLDEATSALDSVNEEQILTAVERLRGRVTIVLISHRLATLRNADAIYVMDAGEIVESGSWRELAARPGGRFESLLSKQRLDGDPQATPRDTAPASAS